MSLLLSRQTERSPAERSPARPDLSVPVYWCWLLLLCGMAVAAASLLAFPLSHLMSQMSFNYSEGWNAYWDAAARAGQPLYAAPPDLNTTNYPPVSFHLIGLLSHLFGSVNITGRIVSTLCLAWCAVNIASATVIITWSRSFGVYAALCFLLWLVVLTPGRIATNDPHFLGLALSTLGMCAYLRAGGRAGWIVLSAVFFVTSLFTKNSLLAFPIAAGLHLIITRRIMHLSVFIGTCALMSGLFIVLIRVVDGDFFLAHLLAARTFDRSLGFENASVFYKMFYAPLLVGVGWSLSCRTPEAGFIVLCVVCAAVLAFGFGFGNGVNYNVHYEMLAAVAVAVAVAAAMSSVQRCAAGSPRSWIVFAVVALIGAAPTLVRTPGELYGPLDRWKRLPERETEYAAALSAVESVPGLALCESLLMCFEAGKPFINDPYYVKDQVAVGRIPEARLIADLDARRYAVIQLGEDEAEFTLTPTERLRFSASVMGAMLANYRVDQQTANYVVMIPK